MAAIKVIPNMPARMMMAPFNPETVIAVLINREIMINEITITG
jgi:hypothetical protein